jgi:DHA1 family multidrug resistance protein-like MFS transporter
MVTGARRMWQGRITGVLGTPWGRALGVLWGTQVTAEIAFSFALPFIPLYIQELGVTDVTEAGLWAGAMAGGFAIAMGVLGPIWGAAADRYGSRLMVQRAMFGAGVMIGAMSLVQSPQQLMVLRILQGCLTGVVAATTTMVSLLVPSRHLGSALGLMHAALFTGGTVGPLVGGFVADHFGYRAAFVTTSAIFFVSGTLVTLFVPEPARTRSTGIAPAADEVGVGGATAPAGGRLLRRELLAVVALSAVIRFANLAPQPVLPLFIQQLGEDRERLATTVGLVLAAGGVAGTLSALAVGRLADRYGREMTLLVCLVAATILSPLHALAGSVWQLLVLRTAMGLALGGMSPAVQAVMTELTPPARRGAAFGMLATAGAIGNGAGPVIGSAVAAAFGIPAVFVVTAPVFLASAALLATLRLPHARSERLDGTSTVISEPS